MENYMITRFNEILPYLPQRISSVLINISDDIKSESEEIRLRAGRPVSLTIKGNTLFLTERSGLCSVPYVGMMTALREEVDECFMRLCNYSVHTHEDEIKDGYISLKNGHRAGICGRTVVLQNKITCLKDISSINIRIAKEIIGCSSRIEQINIMDGLLIAGAPSTGKTTILRDLIRKISSGEFGGVKRVAVIDSRGELAATLKGIPGNDLGPACDIISGCPKAIGIEMALRTLSPEVVAFDEIGMEEMPAVIGCLNAGAAILTTIHAGSFDELIRREQAKTLALSGAVGNIALLKKPVGSSIKVFRTEEVFGENIGSVNAGGIGCRGRVSVFGSSGLAGVTA